jgi:signal peptidase II
LSESSQDISEFDDLRAEQTPGKYILFAVVTIVFTAIDQWTKILVQRNIGPLREEIQIIDGFLSLVHAENPGAAFGMFGGSEYRMYFFAVFTVIALFVLGRMLWELPRDDRFQNVALGLITSGAIGNAIDRVMKQSVTDFIRIYTENPSLKAWLEGSWYGSAEWPSFNIADAAIVVGMGMFLVHSFFLEQEEDEKDGAVSETEPPSPESADAPPA